MKWTASMDKNRQILWITGSMVFFLSLLTYLRTIAPTTSFWDCGEFIACSRILGVMHPPGAPIYLLIGRLLTLIPVVKDIGLRVNLFSAFISAATVLLTYLILIQLIGRWRAKAETWEDRVILYASSALGALAFAFTDSFWFNAVEAEVYAFSMFFTALVVWLALVWGEHESEEAKKSGNILLILFIFYLFGVAIGVHLLNILAFPFVLLIAFFHDDQSVRRLLTLIFLQAAVPLLFYVAVFQYNPASMSYQQLQAHQANASEFFKWFGIIWIIITLIYIYRKDRFVFKVWWVIPVLIVLSYSVYLVIYLRAGLAPPINENDPSTAEAMKYYLARKQYGEEDLMLTFFHRKADLWKYQINLMYTRYFGWQFIGRGILFDGRNRIIEIISLRGLFALPFIAGLFGAVHHFFKDWKRALAVMVLFILTGYAIIIYLNQPDPQPRERDYSYVGSFFAFSLWIGIGMAGIFEWISQTGKLKAWMKKSLFACAGLLLFIAVPLNLFSFNFDSHDRSGNFVAYDYSYNILQSCEPDGIVFTNGDNDTFPLWFLQEVYGIRKDVRVICLSLLNTHWYIKQLRDQEPRVPIGLSDSQIDGLYYMPWQKQQIGIPVPESIRERERLYLSQHLEDEDIVIPDTMKFTVSPTYPVSKPQVLQLKDIMVLRILQAAGWQRPVYFAVTVSNTSKLGLDSYLRMDGLAYKVMPYAVKQIDETRLRRNLLDVFQYRGLDDPDVNLDRGTVNLLVNLRQAFLQLSNYYMDRGENQKALAILDEMSQRIPEHVVPFAHEQTALLVGDYYRRVGRTEAYKQLVQHVLPGQIMSREEKTGLASYYAQVMRDYDRAELLLLELLDGNPRDMKVLSWLLQTYKWSRQYEKGINLLESLKAQFPGDASIEREMKGMKELAAQDSMSNSL